MSEVTFQNNLVIRAFIFLVSGSLMLNTLSETKNCNQKILVPVFCVELLKLDNGFYRLDAPS